MKNKWVFLVLLGCQVAIFVGLIVLLGRVSQLGG